MTIKKILGEHGIQQEVCKGGACPAAIVADDGNIYIQGYIPNAEANAALQAPSGEAFVAIPLTVARRIASQVAQLDS